MILHEWKKWFSWYPVTLDTGKRSYLQIIQRRLCEDHGGEYWEYRKPVVEEETVEDLASTEVSTNPNTPRYSDLPDGFYWIYTDKDGQKVDVCLAKLYTHPQLQQKGLGFGMWDGAGFMPLTDMSENIHLVPVKFSEEDQELHVLCFKGLGV